MVCCGRKETNTFRIEMRSYLFARSVVKSRSTCMRVDGILNYIVVSF